MEIITSPDNKTVKRIGKLKQKKYRAEYGEFFVEGYKNVLDTCAAAPECIKCVALSSTAYGKYGDKFSGYETVVVEDMLFDKLTETESGQGILSINAIPKSAFPRAKACILLDRVRDPGNVGTILRTAVACGYDVIANNCADIYSPKVVRSAMSAIVKCNIGIDINPAELKAYGYELIVADMRGENVFAAEHADKYCIIVGNEADGVSADIIRSADKLLAVPQENIESLNAAVAAAVMMFALKYSDK